MLEWIISSTALISLVIVLRCILKGRISLRLQYALWLLVVLRLLVPVSFGATGLSIGNLTQKAADTEMVKTVSTLTSMELPRMTYSNAYSEVAKEYAERGIDLAEMPAQDLETVDEEIQLRMGGDWTVREILKVLWLLGIAVVGLVLLAANLRFAVILRRSRCRLTGADCPLPVYVSPEVETPCLFGLFRPAVYVTPVATEDSTVLRHILEHELTHFRHGDPIWSLLRGACLALHWYNPLVWWAAVLSRNDAELACDEATIKRIGENERAEYGRTLIAITCQSRPALLLTATTMTGSKNSIKERVLLIARKPKTAVFTLVVLLLILAVSVGCTFTGAKKPEGELQPLTIRTEVGEELPAAVIDYAVEYTQTQLDYYTDELGYEITEAKIVGITQVSTGTAALDSGVNLYLLEYRFLPADPGGVNLAGGMKLEDGYITEWVSTGQPYLLLYWDASGGETVWERVCVTNTDVIEQDYGSPEMLREYGNAYTAAAMELCGRTAKSEEDVWNEENLDKWRNEVSLSGFTVQSEGGYGEVGQRWAESFAAQYMNTSPDNPLHSSDCAVLRCELYAESLLSAPKELIFFMRFACLPTDAGSFERWYAGWAVPLSGEDYPQYEGWMAFGWYVVLQQTGDGLWTCTDAGSGGYGGWGYLNYEEAGEFDYWMANAFSSSGDVSVNLMRILPFADWAAFEEKWGAEGWNVLWQMLDEHCLSQGQVYGPEEDRMWSDVYPNDQAYRNMYVMLTALNTDGTYTEGLADILVRQRNADPELFEMCLQNLPAENGDTIRMLVGAYG